MKKYKTKIKLITKIFFIFLFFYFISKANIIIAATTSLRMGITTYCGNRAVEINEECDKNNLNNQTCISQGYYNGSLKCNSDCTFNKGNCSFQGTQNGGTNPSVITPINNITIKGRAHPLSKVTILKDGQLAVSTIAGPDAIFQVTLSGLSSGGYNIGVYSEDKRGNKSKKFIFPAEVTSGSAIQVTGIFLSPTIDLNKKEVERGENITFFGQTSPGANITVAVEPEITISLGASKKLFKEMKSDSEGVYFYNFNTTELENGDYMAQAKANLNNEITEFSDKLSFKVLSKTSASQGAQNPTSSNNCLNKNRADFNCDGRVNLIDFSIAAFWYKKSDPPDNIDLNKDKKINLIDFSIIAFNWTG